MSTTKSDWELVPVGQFKERWAYIPETGRSEMRVFRWNGKWIVRWNVYRGYQDETLPGGLTLEQAQAAALVLWRMR